MSRKVGEHNPNQTKHNKAMWVYHETMGITSLPYILLALFYWGDRLGISMSIMVIYSGSTCPAIRRHTHINNKVLKTPCKGLKSSNWFEISYTTYQHCYAHGCIIPQRCNTTQHSLVLIHHFPRSYVTTNLQLIHKGPRPQLIGPNYKYPNQQSSNFMTPHGVIKL